MNTITKINVNGTTYNLGGGSNEDLGAVKGYLSSGNFYAEQYNFVECVEIGGLKWATMNVGASDVIDSGLYFQWGDTQGYTAAQVGSGSGQKTFAWTEYKFGTSGSLSKYNSTDEKTMLDLEDDIVTAAWGSNWRMPTTVEFQTLDAAVNTAWTADYQGSGVAGIICTDKTDSSKVLFFPAAGALLDDYAGDVGGGGYYWSSSLYGSNTDYAYRLDFSVGSVAWDGLDERCYGYPVRGVWDGEGAPMIISHELVTPDVNKLYIDTTNDKMYIYNGSTYVDVLDIVNDEFEYGIKWTGSSAPQRIGSAKLHRTLPILSLMRRCIKTENGFRYISNTDYTKYEDGETVNYSTDGDLFVHIPKYWYKAYTETDGNVTYNKIMLYTKAVPGAKESKEVYVGAVEAMSNDASNNSTPSLYSIIKTNFTYNNGIVSSVSYTNDAASYRGGNLRSSSSWDGTASKCCLGRPVTNLTRAQFRERAARRGTGYSQQYWSAYWAWVRLYMVEYCNFNTLATYTSSKTEEGYMQGGLGAGVTTDPDWNSHNQYNPFVPCGVTLILCNNTGIINFSSNNVTYSVPSYRGIENPFGHVWKWMDGVNINVNSSTSRGSFYTCDDITKFADDTTTNYTLRASDMVKGEGYIKTWVFDENAEFIPLTQGGSEASYLYDYMWLPNAGWRVCGYGGSAHYGALAGLFCLNASDGASSYTDAGRGGRLYYTPQV